MLACFANSNYFKFLPIKGFVRLEILNSFIYAVWKMHLLYTYVLNVQVEYDACGFLEKNQDRLASEVVGVLRTSNASIVRSLFNSAITKTGLPLI